MPPFLPVVDIAISWCSHDSKIFVLLKQNSFAVCQQASAMELSSQSLEAYEGVVLKHVSVQAVTGAREDVELWYCFSQFCLAVSAFCWHIVLASACQLAIWMEWRCDICKDSSEQHSCSNIGPDPLFKVHPSMAHSDGLWYLELIAKREVGKVGIFLFYRWRNRFDQVYANGNVFSWN